MNYAATIMDRTIEHSPSPLRCRLSSTICSSIQYTFDYDFSGTLLNITTIIARIYLSTRLIRTFVDVVAVGNATLMMMYRFFDSAYAATLVYTYRMGFMHSERDARSLPPESSNGIQTDGSITSTLDVSSTHVHIWRVPSHSSS
jgi:hypothetical protein